MMTTMFKRLTRSDWNFSTTAEAAMAILLAASVVALAFA